MKIRGAVLSSRGSEPPYVNSLPLAIEELELDAPGETEVLVRIEAAGICHSDLSVVDGSRERPLPMLLGHEAAGIVVGLGGPASSVEIGRRVVASFLPRCGVCSACRTGGRLPCIPGSAANTEGALLAGGRRLHLHGVPVAHHLGVSGFATHAVMDIRSVVPVGDDIPPDIAAVLGCAVLTGGGAVLNVGRPERGQTVAIVGLGGVGMAALLVAMSIEGITVVGVDSNPDKVARALALGATRSMTADEALEGGFSAAVVVECAGAARAFETAVCITAPGGRTVSIGLPAPTAEVRFSPLRLVAEAREIVGSYLGSAIPSRDIPFYESLWRAGRLPVEDLITSHIPLSEINRGLDALASGDVLRQIVEFPGVAA
ncbi:MAG: alcohol dehydrogenase catalytic domain-containing protein [Micrococcales bacterium]|nr:alcohol dehydrogenase catalytic domain-containing protein [Micrococcales bacterium]